MCCMGFDFRSVLPSPSSTRPAIWQWPIPIAKPLNSPAQGAMDLRAMSAVPVAVGEKSFSVRVTVNYEIE